jgi:SAM-dependent methyltransferase
VTSWVYRDARVYRGVLRLLYGGALAERERIVAALVPRGATVVDVCCGDGGIARRLRDVRYLGVDASPRMVEHVRRAGHEARVLDVAREDPPTGDVVLLLGSLYQFLPDADAVLWRVRRAAQRFAIVAEPHVNLASSRVRPVAALARRMTDPGVASSTARFDEASLRALFARHGALHVERTRREVVAVLPGAAP